MEGPLDEPLLISKKQSAKSLDISVRTLDGLIASGEIKVKGSADVYWSQGPSWRSSRQRRILEDPLRNRHFRQRPHLRRK